MIAAIDTQAQTAPILRLAGTLEEETAALGRFETVDLSASAHVKSQALLELMRLSRSLARSLPDAALRDAIDLLRRRLQENMAAISVHLDAARQVTAIMVEAIERDQSDRTYSRPRLRVAPQ